MKKNCFKGCFCVKEGFTLIELLVVVLIIGILAAVAVPQYQKAVLKSRYVQLMALGDAIWKAEQLYLLSNDKWAENLNQLDLDVPGGGNEVIATGQDYRCELKASQGEVYCYLEPEEELMYHRYFYLPYHRCAYRTGKTKSALWKSVCESVSGKTPTTWYSDVKVVNF